MMQVLYFLYLTIKKLLFFIYKKAYDFQLILDNVIGYDEIKSPLIYFKDWYYLIQKHISNYNRNSKSWYSLSFSINFMYNTPFNLPSDLTR